MATKEDFLKRIIGYSNDLLEFKVVLHIQLRLNAISKLTKLSTRVKDNQLRTIESIRYDISEAEIAMTKYIKLLLKECDIDHFDSHRFRLTKQQLSQGYFEFKDQIKKVDSYLNLSTGEIKKLDTDNLPECKSVLREFSKPLLLATQINSLAKELKL